VEPVSGAKFVQSPTDQRLLPGVAERIAELVEMGATLVIASNQGGVEAGHKTGEDAATEMRYIFDLVPEIAQAWYCTTFDGDWAFSVRQDEEATDLWCRNRKLRLESYLSQAVRRNAPSSNGGLQGF
jgi:histidinol phosphatase-like enzyme